MANGEVMTRNSEKWGWTAGWLGGFAWVVSVAVILLVQGRVLECLLGLMLACVAVVLILAAAPWKHPNTPFWKLMLPLYVVLFGAVAWAVWAEGGLGEMGLGWWSVGLLLPVLLPFATIGGRRWEELDQYADEN